MSDYFVEYSQDENQVCIIPRPRIPAQDFFALLKVFKRKGYKWWLPADERNEYIFSKQPGVKNGSQDAPKSNEANPKG